MTIEAKTGQAAGMDNAAMLDTVNVVLNKLREVEPRRSTYTVLIETN
jgi:hypothetical protein